ncbi:hypothetical protein EV360DRAFT_67687 [Lentinula raphanica]|nr:hypothetical protein EV360DRAFT_67687 [Lentinula raphanica]
MILPQSKILTLFAAVVMIPVLALPVPDDSSISDNPPLVLATDVHGPASSPQVVGKEISMSKRMDHGDRSWQAGLPPNREYRPPPAPVDMTPETGPGIPYALYSTRRVEKSNALFPFLGVPPLRTPSRTPAILSDPNFDRLYPMALALRYNKLESESLKALSEKVSMFFIDRQDPDFVYQLKKKSGEKELSLKEKTDIIKASQLFRSSRAMRCPTRSYYAHMNRHDAEKGVNVYYILATAKKQVDDRIEQVKNAVGVISSDYAGEYTLGIEAIEQGRSVPYEKFISLCLADPADGYESTGWFIILSSNQKFSSFFFSGLYKAERLSTEEVWQVLEQNFRVSRPTLSRVSVT